MVVLIVQTHVDGGAIHHAINIVLVLVKIDVSVHVVDHAQHS